jgi:hypothetical protein
LALQCVKNMQDGKPYNWLGLWGSSVGWITGDRDDKQTKAKAQSLGIKNTEFLSLNDEGVVSDQDLDRFLEKNPDRLLWHMMKQFKKPHDLIVLDPIAIFCRGDMNSYQAVAHFLIKLSRRIANLKLSVLAMTHTPKTKSDSFYGKPQDNILGSGAWQAFADTLFTLSRKTGDPMVKLDIKCHTQADRYMRLCHKDNGWFTDDPMQFPTGEAEIDSKPLNKVQVVDWIAEDKGISVSTVYRKYKHWK